MKTYSSSGAVLRFTAPEGGVLSGRPYLIGGILVVAEISALAAAKFDGRTTGVFALTKPDQQAWTEGLALYFDEATGLITSAADDGGGPPVPNTLVGTAARAVPLSLVLATSADPGDLPLSDANSQAATVIVGAFGDLGGKTLTLTVNGVETVLTEGVDFVAETSDPITAANILEALGTVNGITATLDTATITITVTAPAITGRVRLDGAVR